MPRDPKRFSLKDGEGLHAEWVYSYKQTTFIALAVAAFLLLIIAVPQDSTSRDFVLLFGVLSLVGIGYYRETQLTQVILGQIWLIQKRESSASDEEDAETQDEDPKRLESGTVAASQRVPPHGS